MSYDKRKVVWYEDEIKEWQATLPKSREHNRIEEQTISPDTKGANDDDG